MKKVNICYIFNKKGQVLLQYKARGFGKGKWNGPGGKLEPGESVEGSVRREVLEETELVLGKIEERAYLEFVFEGKEEWNMKSYVYVCEDFSGEPVNTGEGELKWFNLEDVPLHKMWDDDKIWFMRALRDKEFMKMRFYFNPEGKLLRYNNIDNK